MVLSVIVPDNRPGMQRMLRREIELANVEAEILITNWVTGMTIAQGDFVCLLERDSGISPGSIARQLEPFLNNPRFRKLAMVSPLIEFDDTEPRSLSNLGATSQPQHAQLTRVGSVGGAIIRRSSLNKYVGLLKKDITALSYEVSTSFWENGLRVINDPLSVYSSPKDSRRYKVIEVSPELSQLWSRECIA